MFDFGEFYIVLWIYDRWVAVYESAKLSPFPRQPPRLHRWHHRAPLELTQDGIRATIIIIMIISLWNIHFYSTWQIAKIFSNFSSSNRMILNSNKKKTMRTSDNCNDLSILSRLVWNDHSRPLATRSAVNVRRLSKTNLELGRKKTEYIFMHMS